jgi:hypothetical protein
LSPIDAAWHVLEFSFPTLAMSATAAAFAKLLWRRELGRARWSRLALWAAAAALLAQVGGLLAFGRDGRIATYAAMAAAAAVALWWAGFARPHR